MLIQGKREVYKVSWRRYGTTWGEPIVHAKRTILGIIPWWSIVWEGDNHRGSPDKMLPSDMNDWFKRTVSDYESYQDAWDEENKVDAL